MDRFQDRASARRAWLRNVLGSSALTLAPASTDASFSADLARVYAYVTEVAGRYSELADFTALLEHCVGDRDLRVAAA